MKRIKILLNGEEKFIASKTSLKDLIDELELDPTTIAIEKNYEIIIPDDFMGNELVENDRIEIVHFIGGG
ncbi:MAG: thiamine biosynthesis protein ThiS [Lentimonas sp.]|jgi:thiamine biosynthesis protein ThiS